MGLLWVLCVLVVPFSVDAAHSYKGLFCVNDFVNNVSCTWHGPSLTPGANCSISGVQKTRIVKNSVKLYSQMIRTCKLEQHGNSPPGCSFAFENKQFNRFKDMPSISLECDGMLVENLTNYKPSDHIKMHPPGVPTVNTTVSDTWISWTGGSPVSMFITSLDFQVQIKQKNQTWKEAYNLSTQELMLRTSRELKGHCQVRVRVYPSNLPNSHWSNWSPTTSWVGATSQDNYEWFVDQTSRIRWRGMSSSGLFLVVPLLLLVVPLLLFVVSLVLYWRCTSKGLHREKPVPSPSKYFHTLHSVHNGNLKSWLNPLSASQSFFTTQPRDHISPVQLCESECCDLLPSSSPSSSSTSTLLHFRPCPLAGSDSSGAVGKCSSASSSFFSNMGYFLSNSSSGSALTDPSPPYFTYRDDFHKRHNSHNRPFVLCPSITPPIYESLKREPQSPDSGFGVEKEDEEEKEEKNAEGEEASDGNQTCPLLILPLHLPSQLCPPSSPPLPPTALSPPQVPSDSQLVDPPVAAAGGSYAAWPSAGAMCRSSSMPVEPCKTGYLTLKELQTTLSNKSI